MTVYVVLENTFDGEWYHDHVVRCFATEEDAQEFIDRESLGRDLFIEEGDLEWNLKQET